MLDKKYLEKRTEYDEKLRSMKTTGMKFTSVSGEKIDPLYGPDDVENINYLTDIGFPGEYPYTRG
ncbi:MAG: methylmalonyl-CoA mutase, partial [Ignavibacteriaceae bacterium]|nr:methylmalonyl-CoA mutase [Ignavibacteriaceae bacterium]